MIELIKLNAYDGFSLFKNEPADSVTGMWGAT